MAKLLEAVRADLATRYQPGTARVYGMWITRYVRYHLPAHPREVGRQGVAGFMTALADAGQSARSMAQALNAVGALYVILGTPLDLVGLRPRQPRTLTTGRSRGEIEAVLAGLRGRDKIQAMLIFGAGLTGSEVARLRVSQVDVVHGEIAPGNRSTVLPEALASDIAEQMALARQQPGNVDGYLFPSSRMHQGRCWHVSPSSLQKALRVASEAAGVVPVITTRQLRESFVEQLLLAGYDVRTVQELVGIKRTERIQRVKERVERRAVRSPLDDL